MSYKKIYMSFNIKRHIHAPAIFRWCVYMHTHTHTAQMGYSVESPGVGRRHLEDPKNPDGLNLCIHIFVYVYKVHMCMYMLGGGMRSWTNYLFL